MRNLVDLAAFLLERGKFSNDQMEQLLDMTIEFSRYMQEGIPVVNYFIYDYFATMSDDYRSRFLQLLQWCTCIPVAGKTRKFMIRARGFISIKIKYFHEFF